MENLSPILLGAAFALFLAMLVHLRRSNAIPFPPGPKPQPLIGNLRHFPKEHSWITYYKWGKQYNSDIVSIGLFGQRVVVLNSPAAAYELLDRRGASYSDRNLNQMIQMVQKGRDSLVFMKYSDHFRAHRKVMNTALNATAVRDYVSAQERESVLFLSRLSADPDNWRSHLRRMTGTFILDMAYGHKVSSDDDYLVTLSERVVNNLRATILPTSFLVNFIPPLRHIPACFPGAGFKRFALDANDLRRQLDEVPFSELQGQIARGEARPSYASRLLDAKGTITGQSVAEEEKMVMTTASVMYGAGADTTVTAIANFITAMALYPDVQARCQTEIDRVIGRERLPGVGDEGVLPFFTCVVAETLRWFPVAPLGIPHSARYDDEYEGMFISGGSTVLANIWAMLRDESMYPDPFKFWPERFDGRYSQAKHPRNFVFGFNRRLCPGRHLAYNMLFTVAAGLIATLNISTPSDLKPGDDAYEFEAKSTMEIKFVPRSEQSLALVKSLTTAVDSD